MVSLVFILFVILIFVILALITYLTFNHDENNLLMYYQPNTKKFLKMLGVNFGKIMRYFVNFDDEIMFSFIATGTK